jgi:hypothetical protein
MQVLGAVIQDLQNRLIGPLNDLKTPKPNPHSDCYLYEAKIPPNFTSTSCLIYGGMTKANIS